MITDQAEYPERGCPPKPKPAPDDAVASLPEQSDCPFEVTQLVAAYYGASDFKTIRRLKKAMECARQRVEPLATKVSAFGYMQLRGAAVYYALRHLHAEECVAKEAAMAAKRYSGTKLVLVVSLTLLVLAGATTGVVATAAPKVSLLCLAYLAVGMVLSMIMHSLLAFENWLAYGFDYDQLKQNDSE
jgi:hypothetical protein